MAAANPCTVLVVDDDRDIRESLLEIFQDEGCESVGAANGAEALSRLRDGKLKPCVILLDLMMPVMDGFSFREEQRKDPALREIPVVVITAYRDAQASARTVQADAVLDKPLELEKLLGTVDGFCPKYAPQRPG